MAVATRDWMDNVAWLVSRRAALLLATEREGDEWRTPETEHAKGARRDALETIEQRLREIRQSRT